MASLQAKVPPPFTLSWCKRVATLATLRMFKAHIVMFTHCPPLPLVFIKPDHVEFHMSSTLSPSLFTHSAAELNSNSRFFKAFILERPKKIHFHIKIIKESLISCLIYEAWTSFLSCLSNAPPPQLSSIVRYW